MRTKLFNLLLTALFLAQFSFVSVEAQESTPTPTVEEIGVGEIQEFSDPALKINFKVGDQEYPSKRFALVFEITSIIESGKIGVDWVYPKNFFKIEGPERDRLDSLVPGQTVTVTKYFTPTSTKPSVAGTVRKVEFGARVLALIPELNYLSSTKIEANFNEEWEISPQGEQYQTEKTVKNILTTLFWIALVVVAGVLIVVGVRKFMRYLNTDDVER